MKKGTSIVVGEIFGRRDFLRAAAACVVSAEAMTVLNACGRRAQGRKEPTVAPSGNFKHTVSSFNPLREKGMPMARQTRSWTELGGFQYDKHAVHPYTRCRIIAMNAVEVESAMFKHMMSRMTTDLELKQALAETRRIEQQQQKAICAIIPGNETVLEHTVGCEQAAVDLAAWCARNEPNPYMRQAYEFTLLEDFDHLYRFSNILDMQRGVIKPERIVGRLTEIMPGRPTAASHRHPFDSIRKPMNINTAAPITLMNLMSLLAAEQQTMTFYMNGIQQYQDPVIRGLYIEIGMAEEQHVSHYASMLDARCSWLLCAMTHEYHECYLYNAFMQQEIDPRVRKIWEIHLDMEIGHLQNMAALYKKIEGEDPADLLPPGMPEALTFESNVDYLRHVLAAQLSLTANGALFEHVDSLPRDNRYFTYQAQVNDGMVPTQEVIRNRIAQKGKDYRFETAPHPVDRFRDRMALNED